MDHSNTVFVASKNKKGKFFLSLKDNRFEGITIEYVMIDTGCNSHLLPLKPGQLTGELHRMFDKYNSIWNVQYSGAVGGRSCTLSIKKLTGLMGVNIPIIKSGVSYVYSRSQFKQLRFHLCRDDVRELLSLEDGDQINLVYGSTKKNHIDRTSLVADLDTITSIRREHALLGQSIIGDENMLLQYQDLCLLIKVTEDKHWSMIRDIILRYKTIASNNINENFEPDEFSELEDENHIADDNDIYSISADDYVD